jgi:hypothetical protein
MKKYTEKLTVIDIKYLNASYYGNPRKRLLLENQVNHRFFANTATNALCGYLSYNRGKAYNFTYHFTRSGNIIIDYAEEI